MTTKFKLTKKLASNVLKVVDTGLCSGLGVPIPGQMCVEAAVCFAMGLEHSDKPTCVSPSLRSLKISLNDKQWSSDKARAKGLRRLAILQLGTADNFNEQEFISKLIDLVARKTAPAALVIASKLAVTEEHKKALQAAANKCKKEGTKESLVEAKNAAYAAAAAYTANAAAYTANAANATNAAAYTANAANAAYAANARDKVLSEFAEDVVQILIDMKVPGVKYLCLTEK